MASSRTLELPSVALFALAVACGGKGGDDEGAGTGTSADDTASDPSSNTDPTSADDAPTTNPDDTTATSVDTTDTSVDTTDTGNPACPYTPVDGMPALALQQVARETRMLRISLEAPIRDVAEFRRGQLNATAEDLEGFDSMLMNVSRDVADWLAVVDKLPERDQAALRDYGVSVEPIRHALASEGFAFERKHLERAGARPLDERLRAIGGELSKVEAALQGSPRVYR